jgi:carboxyl-terminal processing protease
MFGGGRFVKILCRLVRRPITPCSSVPNDTEGLYGIGVTILPDLIVTTMIIMKSAVPPFLICGSFTMPKIPFRRPRVWIVSGVLVAVIVAIIGAQAPPLQDTPIDQLTANIVVSLLTKNHLSKPKLDDEISRRWFKNFLKALDPQKYYFEAGDIERFQAMSTKLDDQIKTGDLSFAKDVFRVFVDRSDERYALVQKLLKEKPDFTIDESIVDDHDKLEYGDKKTVEDRWRKRIKLDLLEQKVDGVDLTEAVKKLSVRYHDRNRAVHQIDMTDLLEIYLTSLATSLDAHSSYMGSKTVEDLMQQLHLSLEGIGASLMSEDGFAVVAEVIPGGAADRDGRLQPDDKIVAIQKDDGEEIDLVEKKLSDVVRYIRGKRGTKVRLVVQPAGTKERKIYEITRDVVQLSDAHAKSKIVTAKGDGGKEVKIGVISLPSFYGDNEGLRNNDPAAVSATKDCRQFLDEFKKAKVDAVLIDLRGNGGGLLTEAISLSGLFINSGPVVQVRDAQNLKELDDDDDAITYTGPLAVLIDHQSASASEIFAGVIRDYGRGLIIGDSSTFGKGTVQSIIDLTERLRDQGLPNLGALKLTIQQFYRANGESTQIKGVPPHIHLPSLLDHLDFGEGKMDNALKYDKIKALPHEKFDRTPADLVNELETRSVERRKSNEKFQKLDDQIKKLTARKERHTIYLNEEKYRAEYISPDDNPTGPGDHSVKRGDKDKPKKRFTDRMAWESNFYNDEVLSIVADYVTLGAKHIAASGEKTTNNKN